MTTSFALTPLPRSLYQPAVENALAEDLGRAGDITSQAVVPASAGLRVTIRSRRQGRLAGLDIATAVFRTIDDRLLVTPALFDGAELQEGSIVATIEGPARAILTAERTALNFLGHLSGIATETARIVAATAGHKAQICCTRKTTPGLRALEKYAVRAGGGSNHRFGLDDAILIKDNHVAVAGSVGAAIAAARAHAGHMVKIEVEVDRLDQLDEALQENPDIIMLDNMTPDLLREAVQRTRGRALLEASGNVTLETAPAIAKSGVDLISVGWITHSAPCLDLGLDFEWTD